MSRQSVSLLLMVMLLIGNIGTLDWQGTGNLTQDNITAIWTYINTNFDRGYQVASITASGDTKYAEFARGLSEHLNGLWAPAWNVVVVYISFQNENADAVLYGYGFRDHWMWYNGFKLTQSFYVSFIIWKDYNCERWLNFNSNDISSPTPTSYTEGNTIGQIQSSMSTAASRVSSDNIWEATKTYVDLFETDSDVTNVLGASKAFSAIICRSSQGYFYANFCVKDYAVNLQKAGSTPLPWGTVLLMQMR